jgi:hypothetical protein
MLSTFSPYTTGRPASFLYKTLSVSLGGLYPAYIGGLGSGVSRRVFLKRLWKCVSDFVSINHSTHMPSAGSRRQADDPQFNRIQDAITTVDVYMLQRTWMQPECHLGIAHVIKGGHVESVSVSFHIDVIYE